MHLAASFCWLPNTANRSSSRLWSSSIVCQNILRNRSLKCSQITIQLSVCLSAAQKRPVLLQSYGVNGILHVPYRPLYCTSGVQEVLLLACQSRLVDVFLKFNFDAEGLWEIFFSTPCSKQQHKRNDVPSVWLSVTSRTNFQWLFFANHILQCVFSYGHDAAASGATEKQSFVTSSLGGRQTFPAFFVGHWRLTKSGPASFVQIVINIFLLLCFSYQGMELVGFSEWLMSIMRPIM